MGRPDNEFEKWCRHHLAKMDATLMSIDESLRGPQSPNGRLGVFGRLDRLEVAAKSRVRAYWVVIVGVVALVIKQSWEMFKGS